MSDNDFSNPDLRREQDPTTVAWGGVTNPLSHNPEQFRYLVHAINPLSKHNALLITLYEARDGVTHDETWGDQKISMYEQPERLAERVSLSMSLIDQDHTGTWGEAGLIVEAPEHNVVLTSVSDAGTHNNNLDFLMSQADKHGVMNGDALLQYSYPSSYNEVVAVANRDGSKAELKGFFFKVTSSGEPYNVELARRMQLNASRLALPIVAITEQSPYAEDKVEVNDGKTAVHFNGHRYILDGYEAQWQFQVLDDKRAGHFAASHEIEAALSYALESGAMTQEQVKAIAAKYETANSERQTPKVEFDEDGTVKEIAFYEGYGATEHKVSIGKNGHGYRINLARQSEELQKSMLDQFHMSNDPYTSYMPLSPVEANAIVEWACQALDKEVTSKVMQWFYDNKQATEQQWQHFQDFRRTRSGGLGLISLGLDDTYRHLDIKSNTLPVEPKSQTADDKKYSIKDGLDVSWLLKDFKKDVGEDK